MLPLLLKLPPFEPRLLSFTFYQITTKIGSVYSVSLPAEVNAFLDTITSWISLGLTGVVTTPLECVGLSGCAVVRIEPRTHFIHAHGTGSSCPGSPRSQTWRA